MSPSILIVDDDKLLSSILATTVQRAGYNVVGQASNGHEAVQLYRQLKPDLVLLDIIMPDMSGLEVLKEIRSLDPEARVIICSALGHQDMIIQALKAGALDFLVKPFTLEKVREVLRKAWPG